MVIYGYTYGLGFEWIDIDDPIYGKSHISLTDFSTNYQGSGSWTHAYITKPYFQMPIIPILIDDRIINLIWDPRTVLNQRLTQNNVAGIDGGRVEDSGNASVGLARRVYTLELASMLQEERPNLVPSFLRVFESVDGLPSAFYDVVEGPQPRLINRSGAKHLIDQMMKGTEKAIATLGDSANPAEIRQLRFPAMNFEAVWLHFEDEQSDKLIQTSNFGPLPPQQPIGFSEGMVLLREAARPLANMDDEQGS